MIKYNNLKCLIPRVSYLDITKRIYLIHKLKNYVLFKHCLLCYMQLHPGTFFTNSNWSFCPFRPFHFDLRIIFWELDVQHESEKQNDLGCEVQYHRKCCSLKIFETLIDILHYFTWTGGVYNQACPICKRKQINESMSAQDIECVYEKK